MSSNVPATIAEGADMFYPQGRLYGYAGPG